MSPNNFYIHFDEINLTEAEDPPAQVFYPPS
jgi:hypothetical protein